MEDEESYWTMEDLKTVRVVEEWGEEIMEECKEGWEDRSNGTDGIIWFGSY